MTEETPAQVAKTAESPSKNGLGTILGLVILVLSALATAAATIAGDPDTAKLTGGFAVFIGGITQVGKYAQATAAIAGTAKSSLPQLEGILATLRPPSVLDEEEEDSPEVENDSALDHIEVDEEDVVDPEATTKPDLPLEDIDSVNGGDRA